MYNISFDLVMGRANLERPGRVLDFRMEEALLDYQGRQGTLPMVLE